MTSLGTQHKNEQTECPDQSLVYLNYAYHYNQKIVYIYIYIYIYIEG